MITSFAEKLTDSAIRHGVISGEGRNVYHYGFELMVSTAVHALIVIIAGIVMKSLMESLLFWWVLAVVRGQTGGYHAETYLKCNIVFALVLTASLWWAKYSAPYYNYAVIIIQFAVYFITVLFLCPVENKNKPLNSEHSSYVLQILPHHTGTLIVPFLYMGSEHEVFTEVIDKGFTLYIRQNNVKWNEIYRCNLSDFVI